MQKNLSRMESNSLKNSVQLRSIYEDEFQQTILSWFSQHSLLLVMVRYLNTGGGKDFSLLSSFREFDTFLRNLPAVTDVIVFQVHALNSFEPESSKLLIEARKLITKEKEWLLLWADNNKISGYEHAFGDDLDDLKQAVRNLKEKTVYFGEMPAWWEMDSDTMQSAIVPNEAGLIQSGAG
ncbi:MAG: hypothetical protein HOP19_25380 [Acidobacteria bacterium]|nr:hypothetical protein [Acidobacteriota bacterium]